MKVVVLATSYPRSATDTAGRFVADAVEHLREAGTEIEVVSPASFKHFRLAYGSGIVGNLRRRPWRAALVPAFLAAYSRAARRAARDADLVHAHWLPSGIAALATGRPFVVQLWGTDVELARRAPSLARAVIRRAEAVVCPSAALAGDATRLGARQIEVVPSGVELPAEVGEEADPPEVLYAGRLSPEKGVVELMLAAEDLNLVVAGDGPLRDRVPMARGMLPPAELAALYARAAVVVCPSLREGFGVACLEAMAHGRPVVASGVGGLLDLVVNGETGILVEPGNVPALRTGIDRLLGDRELRRSMGEAGRRRAAERFSWDAVTRKTQEVYARYAGKKSGRSGSGSSVRRATSAS
ncbi:MAG TPA: glycosyltransferase family 4 protein [Gaiellaceae bacterium]|nr:glycosyltransferase family 4 protein [Gaiellaceae bacterium]